MIAAAMVEPRTCVVEVTQVVPADDVPYVAARVAERLGMPLERVRKLIDDRTGPITRPLRPDKAEVIAQTFEAAGVAVAVRPATEEDEFPLLGASSVAAPASASTPGTGARDEPAGPVVRDEPERPAVAAEPEVPAPSETPEVPAPSETPEVRAPSETPEVPAPSETPGPDEPESREPTLVEPVVEEGASDGFEREASDVFGGDAHEPEPEPEFEPEPEPEPEFEPEPEPEPEVGLGAEREPVAEPEAEDADSDVAAVQDAERDAAAVQGDDWGAAAALDAGVDEPGAYDVESDEPGDDQLETEPDDFGYDDLDVDEFDPDAVDADGASAEFEPEGAMEEGDDGTPPHVPHRPPVAPQGLGTPFGAPLRLDPEVDEDDDTDDPGPFGWPARGEVTVRPLTAATLAASEIAEATEGAEAVSDAETDEPSSDPISDGYRSGAAVAPASAARAVDVGAQNVSEGAAQSPDSGRQAPRSPFGDPTTWHGDDDPAGGWTIGPRATRRLPVVTDEPDGVADLADEYAASEAPPTGRDDADYARADVPEDVDALAVPDEDREDIDEASDAVDEAAYDSTVPLRVVRVDQSPVADAAQADGPPLVGRVSRIRDRAAEGTSHDTEEPADGAAATTVPTAWRGLGGGERGPARPVDARLPRRGEHAPPVTVSAAARVTRRRTLMLVALAIALGVFVLAQAWVAGRAAPAFDAGLHRFRDADFGAARRVWTDLASHGDANAQFMLGYMSEAGLGRPWSARAAAAWYRLAADAGHAEARWRLGNLYHQGLGVAPDAATAERWWAAAADAGHAEAAFTLGRSRLEGASGASDPRGALVAFERAAALGWPAAVPYGEALKAVSERPHPDALP